MYWVTQTVIFSLSFFAGRLLAASWREAGQLETVRQSIVFPDLPPALEELSILHLSDLHGPCRESLMAQVIQTAEGLKPDLIVITGDLAGNRRELGLAETVIRSLKAPLGIWCVYGNNDLHLGRDLVAREVRRAGGKILDNASTMLKHHGTPLRLVGINHKTQCSPRWRLQELAENGPFTIVLAHAPDAARKVLLGDLVMAGHTHGGQLNLPPFTLINRHAFGEQVLSGLTVINGRPVYISRGIGTQMVPLRFRCRPEVSLLTLTRREQPERAYK